MRKLPSLERILELVEYNQSTGEMFYRTASGYRNCKKAGRPINSVDKDGYITGTLDGVRYFMHRIAYNIIHAKPPERFIDHINGDKSDNRASNLRDVSYTTNNENQRFAPSSNKQSLLLGAHRAKDRKRWASHIKVGGKTIHLGCFDTAEEAHQAYIQAKRKFHEGNTL